MIAAIIAIMLFFTRTTDGAYLSARNVSNLLRQTAITGILAVGMVFVIISAEIDLSVGSMMGLLGGVAAICDVWLGLAFATYHHCDVGSGTASRCPERMVGRVPQSPFIYCHPRGHVGISRHTHWHHQRHDCFPPTSAAMSQIGQSYLPASTGFIIGALGLMAFVGWQWRGRMRRQALGLQSPASTAVVGRQGFNRYHRIRRNLAVE